MITVLASLLATAVPASALPPVVGVGDPVVYTEGSDPVPAGGGISISVGDFRGQYLEFDANGPGETDLLSMVAESSPVFTAGIVSIWNGVVYLGNGSGFEQIGEIDPIFNGTAGRALRVNFTQPFTNGSFEAGLDGLTGWTASNERIDLGVTTLGYDSETPCTSIDTSTYPSPPDNDDTAPDSESPGIYSTSRVTIGADDNVARLRSSDIRTTDGFDIVHGPAIISSPFNASTGDTIRFDWRAFEGDDAHHVLAYVVDASCNQTELLDAQGFNDSSWSSVTGEIPVGGSYRLVFVSGSYDAAGDTYTGATTQVDNVRLVGGPAVPASVAQAVAQLLMYASTSDDIVAPTTRTIVLTVQAADEVPVQTAITIDFQPAAELPLFVDEALADAQRGVVYSDGVSASGWPTPTYEVTVGTLPAGLVLNTSTGAVTGTPTTAGAFPFTITASNGQNSSVTAPFPGVVTGSPTGFTDDSIGSLVVGTALTDGVLADGYPAPSYTIFDGALPAGLSLNEATGAITGTPTGVGGAYSFTVRATNLDGYVNLQLSGTVDAAPVFTDSTLDRVTTAAALTDGVFATAVPAATYIVTPNLGTLPTGLVLDTNTGAITGTATQSGPYSFSITASNGIAPAATVALSGTVFTSPLLFTDLTIGRILVGASFNDAVVADGIEPPTYEVTDGAIPAGLTLATDGSITGVPTGLGGAYSFTVTATNSEGSIFTTVTGTVFAAPTAFTDAALGHIRTLDAYSDSVTANGVLAPSYTMTAGAIPAGLELSSSGAVTGIATTPGAFSFWITAENDDGSFATNITGTVYDAPVFTDTTLGRIDAGVAYTDAVAATALPAATYTVTAGSLPVGLTLNSGTGVISGTTTVTGPYSFSITADNEEPPAAVAAFSGNVFGPPVFVDETLGQMRRGVVYSDGVSAPAWPAAVYAVSIGSLPPGLTLTPSTGVVSGTPTTSGSFPFTIIAANTEGSASRSFTGVVVAPPIAFSDSTIAQLIVGTALVDGVLADGNPAPTYETTSGTLPAGLELNSITGEITGTPTGSVGAYSFTVTATNSSGSFPVTLTGTVYTVPAFTDTTLSQITTTSPYSDGVFAVAIPAATYTVSAGTLPAGLALDEATGGITGTALNTGPYDFTITANNNVGTAPTFQFTGTILAAPITFTDSTIDQLVVGTIVDDEVLADGVPAPTYTIVVIDGEALPVGLELNATTGAITGTPTGLGGPYVFTVRATNSVSTFDVQLSGFVNASPVFTDSTLERIDTATVTSDGVFATAVPAATYEVTVGTLPAGLVLNENTGAITGTATAGGPYSFTITATNNVGTPATAELSGFVYTTPFVFTDGELGRMRVGDEYSDGVLADGVESPTYEVTVGTLPAGLVLNEETGAITGTPTGLGGSYSFTITATNSEGFKDLELSGTVFARPVFTDEAIERLVVGTAFEDGVFATAVNAATYEVTAGTLPGGLTLNATTGAITGTPTGLGGDYTFTITASNAELPNATTTLTGTLYAPPVFTDETIARIAVGTVLDDGVFATAVNAATYEVTAGALPTGLTLNATTGAITGTPTGLGGDYSFTITASNAELPNATTTLTGTLYAAPVFTDTTIARLEVGTTLTDGVFATAVDAATYEVTAGALPTGLELNTATGAITGNPTVGGTYTFTITASNAELPNAITTLNGDVFAVPVFVDDTLGTMQRGVVYNDGVTTLAWPLAVYAISAGALPPGLTLVRSTGTITGTPTTAGAFPFTIIAANIEGSAARSFSGVVLGAPLAFSDSTIGELTIGTVFADGVVADGVDPPTYEVTAGTLPTGLTLNEETGAITGTPTGLGGAYAFTVTATNSEGHLDLPLSGAVSAAPVFTDVALARISTASPFDDGVFATAFPAATYMVTAGTLPAGLVLNEISGAITGTATTGGTYAFTITASNGVGEPATLSMSGPVFTSPMSFTDDTVGHLQVGVAFVDGVSADGVEPPVYTYTGTLPAGLELNSETGAITGTPTTAGEVTFTIIATNSEGHIDLPLTVTVYAAPVFTDTTIARIVVGSTLTDGVFATALPAATYEVTAGALPAGLVLNEATGAITGTPTGLGGDYTFTITASNGELPNATTTVTGILYAPPVFTDIGIGRILVGTVVDEGVFATAVEAARYEVTAGALPPGLELNEITGAVTGTPTGLGGDYSFTVTATNGETPDAVITLTGTLYAPPVFTDSTIGRLVVGTPVEDAVLVTSNPEPIYQITAGLLPAGLVFNEYTGVLTGTPTGLGGDYSFTIEASNGAEPNAYITLTGTVYAPPVFTDYEIARIVVGTVLDDAVFATALPAATYEVTGGALPAGLALNEATGAITGTPTGLGGDYTFTITATNGEVPNATTTLTGTLYAAPVFTDVSLARISTATAFDDDVFATAVPAATYTVTGGTLPAGLSLDEVTGAITGLATEGGPFDFTITASNSEGSDTTSFEGLVYTSPFVFTDDSIGRLRVGLVFLDGVAANGVESPTYTVSEGALPAGLTLNDATGAITGTPTGLGGAYSFTVTATNEEGHIDLELTGTVFAAPVFTDETLARMDTAHGYVDGVSATAVLPATYAVTAGALPAGLTLNPTTGAITGTPTMGGAYSLTITATNDEGTDVASFNSYVYAAPIAFVDSAIGDLKVGDAFVDGVLAYGTPAVTYAVTSGALPDGLTLNTTTGSISGTPTDAAEGPYSFTITVTNTEGSLPVTLTGTVIARDLGFLGLGPIRLLDTRQGAKPAGGSVTPISVDGVAGVPVDATSVVLNITVQSPETGGYLTVFPCGSPIPYASNANFRAGETIPASVTAAIGVDGRVCIYTSASAQLVVDLNGAFSPTMGGGKLLGFTPARLLDTRGEGGKLVGGQTQVVQVAGVSGVPLDATSVVLNVTADSPSSGGYATVYPCGTAQPNSSNLNFLTEQTVANSVTVGVGAAGTVCVFSTATTHLIIDVGAAYSPSAGTGELFWMEPTRMFDSRALAAKVVGGTVVELTVAGAGGIPANATAVALNITIDSPESGGYVTVYPCGAPAPYASNLNFTPDRTVANSVLATVGANGKVCFLVTGTAHLIIDANAAYVS